MSDLTKCPKCNAPLDLSLKRQYSIIDLVDVLIVGAIVFGFLSLFLFSSHVLRGVVFVGGLLAFGLFHMVGYSKVEQSKCIQCGHINDHEITSA